MLIASEKKKKIKDKENLNLFTRNDESTAPPTGTQTEPTTAREDNQIPRTQNDLPGSDDMEVLVKENIRERERAETFKLSVVEPQGKKVKI